MNQAKAQSLVDKWNRKHKPGTEVVIQTYYDGIGYEPNHTKTRGVAYVADGVAMVSVEGIEGGVKLECVEAI